MFVSHILLTPLLNHWDATKTRCFGPEAFHSFEWGKRSLQGPEYPHWKNFKLVFPNIPDLRLTWPDVVDNSFTSARTSVFKGDAGFHVQSFWSLPSSDATDISFTPFFRGISSCLWNTSRKDLRLLPYYFRSFEIFSVRSLAGYITTSCTLWSLLDRSIFSMRRSNRDIWIALYKLCPTYILVK